MCLNVCVWAKDLSEIPVQGFKAFGITKEGTLVSPLMGIPVQPDINGWVSVSPEKINFWKENTKFNSSISAKYSPFFSAFISSTKYENKLALLYLGELYSDREMSSLYYLKKTYNNIWRNDARAVNFIVLRIEWKKEDFIAMGLPGNDSCHSSKMIYAEYPKFAQIALTKYKLSLGFKKFFEENGVKINDKPNV